MLETDCCRSGRVGSNSQGPDVLKKVGDGVQGKEICYKVGSSAVPALARLRHDDHEEFEASLGYVVFFLASLGFAVKTHNPLPASHTETFQKNSV